MEYHIEFRYMAPGARTPSRSVQDEPIMAKEFRTAEQLSDLIVSALGVNGLDIQVRKDHAYGWQPTVVSSPGDLIGYQRRVEAMLHGNDCAARCA